MPTKTITTSQQRGSLRRHIHLAGSFVSLLLLFHLSCPAWAAGPSTSRIDDPLVLRLICASNSHESGLHGPGYSRVSAFSMPEPDGKGERLYVGLVAHAWYRQTPLALWRGPVAARWEGLRPVPEWKSLRTARNANRYRIDRLSALPGGGLHNATMEIDLEAHPPELRLVGSGPGQPKYLETQPLGEEIPVNEALELIIRLHPEVQADTAELRLRAYHLFPGENNPGQPGERLRGYWEAAWKPYLLAVCRKNEPGQSILHFLPPRFGGWHWEGLVSAPAEDDPDGSFVVQMLSQYMGEDDQGRDMDMATRSHVSVSLRGISSKTVADNLSYDPETDAWTPYKPAQKRKAKAKP